MWIQSIRLDSMNPKDDYISGPHNYWVHFIFGFVFGAFFGGWFGGWLIGGILAVMTGTLTGGCCVGLSCAKWGDRAWKAILNRFGGGDNRMISAPNRRLRFYVSFGILCVVLAIKVHEVAKARAYVTSLSVAWAK